MLFRSDNKPTITERDNCVGYLVAEFRTFAEREERFMAACAGTRPSDRANLVGCEVRLGHACRWLSKRAVVARVVAEKRERDEDLGQASHCQIPP